MFDERAFVARVESANTDELVAIVLRPTSNEEKALRAHLGDRRFERLHNLAQQRGSRRGVGETKGNVVVLHGIMGGELSSVDRAGDSDPIWAKVFRIMTGRLDRLRLADDGLSSCDPLYDVRASGILKRYYGELLLSLAQSWNVRAFWFDWRKDLKHSAAELNSQIQGWFDDETPVHFVAHSMGGLVARTFIANHSHRWEAMWDRRSARKGERGGRLIMLGTPNHGSFAIPQTITGLESIVKKLARFDFRHNLDGVLQILNTFVGSYQMLPSPLILKSMEPLYRSETYGRVKVPQAHLDTARKHHQQLSQVVDVERMVYVAGYGQPTFSNIRDLTKLDSNDAYEITLKGDGRVTHELGLLKTPQGQKVPTFYVEENHGDLTVNPSVLTALDDLLATGTTTQLAGAPPATRGLSKSTPAGQQQLREQLRKVETDDESDLEALLRRAGTRGVYVTPEERQLEGILTRNYLSYRDEEGPMGGRQTKLKSAKPDRRENRRTKYTIEIGLVNDLIESIGSSVRSKQGEPVDAISVGHYTGVRPQAAELALDRAISRALLTNGKQRRLKLAESDLVLTQYSDRGVLLGELGQSFFLPDPRVAGTKQTTKKGRLIAIAGMGRTSTFGVPELTVVVQELCWALGRIGYRHLATVLIGAGNGNLPIKEAIDAWMRGIKRAVTGSVEDQGQRLKRITFVEFDPRRIEDIDKAIKEERRRLAGRLDVKYKDLTQADLNLLKPKIVARERQERKRREQEKRKERESWHNWRPPTRVTAALERGIYRFGAITESASIPEREIPLDPALVASANDELAAEWAPRKQLERGKFLERLLVPDSLRPHLFSGAPLVMVLDATTARVHWELMAQSDLGALEHGETAGDEVDFREYFLGTSRGFTRQLRTTFAPPPEPPPPPRRNLRVLVVADPAEDARLLGAEQEGVEVADLFESFNQKHHGDNRVEVVRMFGPSQATRTNVLRELMSRSYDVLHFAGHCSFDEGNPASSGWIFSGGARLTAHELNRIDRIPKFVFSNACQSGITPDRSEMRSAQLAPTFAEAFFKQGVANFVCTAWPVDDSAARLFARRLYSGLLGLQAGAEPEPMHAAMREARLAIAECPEGTRTWGAYQHYGNPYLRFFEGRTPRRSGSDAQKKATGKRRK